MCVLVCAYVAVILWMLLRVYVRVCVCVCVRACVCGCARARVRAFWLNVCMDACVCAFVFVSVCACVYADTRTRKYTLTAGTHLDIQTDTCVVRACVCWCVRMLLLLYGCCSEYLRVLVERICVLVECVRVCWLSVCACVG